MKAIFVSVGAFFIFSSAMASPAIIGTYLPDSENPAATCKIVSSFHRIDPDTKKNTKYEATCSSTVVGKSKDRVITASHCFDESFFGAKIEDTKITCAGQVYQAGKPTTQPAYGGVQELKDAGGVAGDVAFLPILNPDQKLSAMKLPSSFEEAKKLLASGKCRLSGYGIDNLKATGVQHTVEAPVNYAFGTEVNTSSQQGVFFTMPDVATSGDFVTYGDMMNDLYARKLGKAQSDPHTSNKALPGDSGGSVYCNDPITQEDVLIAVIGTTSPDERDFAGTLVNSKVNQVWIEQQLQ